ncbi:hypothetical protein ACXYL9_11715 [Qipengyuania sp. CAU 1752]
MNRLGKQTTPWHLWVVGIAATLWNGFGAIDYTMTQTANQGWFASMGIDQATTDAMLELLGQAPAWADAAWAFGVWGGLAGSLLLLFRSRWAVMAFAVSIAGVLVSMIYQSGVDYPPQLEEMGNSPMMGVVLLIAAMLLWYAWVMRKRGLLS